MKKTEKRIEVAKLIQKLASGYTNLKMTEEAYETYTDAFEEESLDDISKAIKTAIDACKFFPSVSELKKFLPRKEVGKFTGENDSTFEVRSGYELIAEDVKKEFDIIFPESESQLHEIEVFNILFRSIGARKRSPKEVKKRFEERLKKL